jgi:hypothetical protein
VLEAAWDQATTCTLVTPSNPGGVDCFGAVVFMTKPDLNGVTTEIGTPWTLTWDKDSSPTEVTISFPSLSAGDWPLLPSISNPLDGATGVSPNTTIDWNYGSVAACDAQTDDFSVQLFGPNGEQHEVDGSGDLTPEPGELPCTALSWQAPAPLAAGWWDAIVVNDISIVDVPDGLTIPDDTWVLDNQDWLSLGSVDSSHFLVPEPTTALLLGSGLIGLAINGRKPRR